MKNKKSLILSIIVVVTLLVLVVGATFAYFTAGGGASTSANVKVETSNEDILTFVVGDPINIEATQTTFASGKGNASGSTTAKAILKTANEENELKANYYLYLNISKNEFSYTTEDNTAELLLKITDPSGNQVTSLDGLTYKTLTDGSNTSQSGFDITTKSGLITIANNKEIKAKPEAIEEWKVEIIFVNLDKDQSGNAGKSLTAKLLLQKEGKEKSLSDVCSDGDNLASCIKTYANNGSAATSIYIHDSSLANGAGDNSYRYAGANPNNYVCFGSDAESCPNDNLYRIIGVFGDKVKLIKADYATSTQLGATGAYYGAYDWGSDYYKGSNYSNIASYYWNNETNNNTWSESNLNKANLNGTYLTNLGTAWTSKIETTLWKVGGNTYANISEVTAPNAYQNEIVSPAESTTYSDKIGLMYASDYGFAAGPSAWTTTLYEYDSSSVTSINWMYMGLHEWTISRRSDGSDSAFYFLSDGYLDDFNCMNYDLGVRPVFFLTSSTTYVLGNGLSNDPVRVN